MINMSFILKLNENFQKNAQSSYWTPSLGQINENYLKHVLTFNDLLGHTLFYEGKKIFLN